MQSEEVLEPREMVELRSRMKQEQQEAGTKCRVLLHKVLDLKPPLVNTAQVYEWREEMDQFYLDLGKVSVCSIAEAGWSLVYQVVRNQLL